MVHINKGQCGEKAKVLVIGPAVRILATSLQMVSRSYLSNRDCEYSDCHNKRKFAFVPPLSLSQDRLFPIPEVVSIENRLPEPFPDENILPA